MDGQLGLQLDDPSPRGDQIGQVDRRDAGHLAGVDELLAVPVIDRLIADLKIVDQLGHGPAGLQQIKNLTAELGRISSRHI